MPLYVWNLPGGGKMYGRTDTPSYRDARTHLKKEIATKTTNYNYFKACTAHSFACAALLASLKYSAALICSLARSLTHSRAHGKEIYVKKLNASISFSFNPLCGGGSNGEEKLVFIQTKKAAAA